MNEEELKPCPFCGGKAYIKKTSRGHSNTIFTVIAELGCRKCGYHMIGESEFDVDEFMNIHMLDRKNGIKEMIEKWNRRAADER